MRESSNLVTLMRPDGQLIRVPREGTAWANTNQTIGFGIGYGAAVLKMVTLDVLASAGKAISETNFGCGVSHGYQTAYVTKETLVERSRLKKNNPFETIQMQASQLGFDPSKMQDEEVWTVVAKAKVTGLDAEKGKKSVFPAFHKPPTIIVPQKQVIIEAPQQRFPSPLRGATSGSY